jgi:hypothetical protein
MSERALKWVREAKKKRLTRLDLGAMSLAKKSRLRICWKAFMIKTRLWKRTIMGNTEGI